MSRKHENSGGDVLRFPASQPAPVLFGPLLKARRRQACLSQQDLADMMHVTRNTVINWEADRSKPDYALLPELCNLLSIPVSELFQMQAQTELSALEKRVVGNLRLLEPSSRRVVDRMVSAMVEEELREKDRVMKASFALFPARPGTVAAGTGDEVPDEAPGFVFLRKNHISERADGIARVNGHSMEPVYRDGDDVYYREASAASPGEDVIVDTDDGAVIKRVDDDYTLYSVNPDPRYAYPQKSEQNTLVIRGVVLGTVHSSDRPAGVEQGILEELFADEIRSFRASRGHSAWD